MASRGSAQLFFDLNSFAFSPPLPWPTRTSSGARAAVTGFNLAGFNFVGGVDLLHSLGLFGAFNSAVSMGYAPSDVASLYG